MVRNKGTFNQTSSRMGIRGNFLIPNFSSDVVIWFPLSKGASALESSVRNRGIHPNFCRPIRNDVTPRLKHAVIFCRKTRPLKPTNFHRK
jgi:hypothetical protein